MIWCCRRSIRKGLPGRACRSDAHNQTEGTSASTNFGGLYKVESWVFHYRPVDGFLATGPQLGPLVSILGGFG